MPKLTRTFKENKSEIQVCLEELGFTNPSLKYLLALCQCKGDVNVFCKYFYSGVKREVFHEIMTYRDHLIKSRNLEINQFLTTYRMNRKKAMERLFLLPIGEEVITEYETHLSYAEFELSDLYIAQLKNPELNPLLLLKELLKK